MSFLLPYQGEGNLCGPPHLRSGIPHPPFCEGACFLLPARVPRSSPKLYPPDSRLDYCLRRNPLHRDALFHVDVDLPCQAKEQRLAAQQLRRGHRKKKNATWSKGVFNQDCQDLAASLILHHRTTRSWPNQGPGLQGGYSNKTSLLEGEEPWLGKSRSGVVSPAEVQVHIQQGHQANRRDLDHAPPLQPSPATVWNFFRLSLNIMGLTLFESSINKVPRAGGDYSLDAMNGPTRVKSAGV